MKATQSMNIQKTPVVSISGTINRALLMFIAIIIGVILSYSTAEAGVRNEKNPVNKVSQKKKTHSYSCKVLMEKHRSSTNIVVKTNQRRPKWR